MSYVSQFLSGTSSSGGSGGKPIGAMELFPPNMGNSFTLPDGSQYLLGGVIGKSSDYPSVPSVFLKQLSPVTKVSDIGSGGVWRAMAIDTLGFPVVLQSTLFNLNGYAYRITGTSTTSSNDVALITNTITNYPGSWGLSIAVTNNSVIIGRDFTQSLYGNGPLHTYSVPGGTTNSVGQSYVGSGNWQAVASSGSIWLAVPRGGSSSVWGSSFGGNSTVVTTTPAAWTAAACNNLRFVVIATGTNVMNYSDALSVTTWSASTMPSSAQWISVASNGSGFMAIAANSTTAATSANGITWVASTLPVSQNWTSVCWSNTLGKYVAIAKGSNTGATSADGTSWSTITLPKVANWESVVFSTTLNRLFISGSDGTGVWMSDDGGVTWVEKTMPRAISFERIEYTNGGFNAYTFTSGTPSTNYPHNPITARSTDGVNWTYNNAIPSTNTYAESPLRSVGTNLAFTSSSTNSITMFYSSNNGSTYSSVPILSSFSYSVRSCDIAFNGTRYVAPIVEWYDTFNTTWQMSPWIVSSTSIASGWAVANIGLSAHWRCVVSHNSTFIMAGYNDTGNLVIARSIDGVTWTSASYPTVQTNNQDMDIRYDSARNLWIMTFAYNSFSGALVSSDDGASWLVQLKTYGCLAQNGTRYTAVVGTTNNTYTDPQSTNLYAAYTHGVAIKANTTTAISGYCAPLNQGGTNYYISSGTMYTVDSAMYVDNRGSPSETSGQAYYYMRVK